jgi:hypothetical protein
MIKTWLGEWILKRRVIMWSHHLLHVLQLNCVNRSHNTLSTVLVLKKKPLLEWVYIAVGPSWDYHIKSKVINPYKISRFVTTLQNSWTLLKKHDTYFKDVEVNCMMVGFGWNGAGSIWVPDHYVCIRTNRYTTLE